MCKLVFCQQWNDAPQYNDERSVLITEPEVHRGEPGCSSATQGKAFAYVQTTIITTTANGERHDLAVALHVTAF